MNFLQSIRKPMMFGGMPPASMPMIGATPPAAVPPAMPQFMGNFQRMVGTDPAPVQQNVLEAIGGTPDTPPVQMPQPSQEQPRKRSSFLDALGGLADAVAIVGGSQPMYQPTLDARAAREQAQQDRDLAMQDRERQIGLDALRQQILEQQYQTGEMEIEDTGRARLARALGAVASDPENGTANWRAIAQQAGIDEQTAAQVEGLFGRGINPTTLAQSLGWQPEAPRGQGSQAKEAQIYSLLLENAGPEAAQAYLQNLTNPDSMSEYQRAQLALAMNKFGFDQEKFAYDRERDLIEDEQGAAEAATAAAGEDSNSVASILTDFGVTLEGPNDPVADMIKNSTNGWVQYGAAMIPGAFGQSTEGMEQIAKLQTIDNALILALAGGKLGAGVSNADRSFFEKMAGRISDPTIPADQRLAAWNQIKTRFKGVVQREQKKPARAPATRPRANARSTSRGGGGSIVTVSSPEDARKLPAGARFRTPDGRVRIKR